MLGVAHVVERMPHLVGHGMADWLTGTGAKPEGANLVIVAATVAHPVLGVVEQHHHFVFRQVRLHGVDKAQPVDFQVIERFALAEQVLLVDAVCLRRFRGLLRAVVLVPKHDDVVRLHASRLRPRVLAVGVALLVEQRVAWPRVPPLVGNVNRLLCHHGRSGQQEDGYCCYLLHIAFICLLSIPVHRPTDPSAVGRQSSGPWYGRA